MKKFITNKIVLYTLGIILFFLIWLVISLIVNSKTIFPTPWETISYAFSKEVLFSKSFYISLGYSFLKLVIGFIIALILAFIFGLIAGNNKHLYELFKPTMTVLKSIPTACVVFIFLVILRAKYTPILIVTLISFPILYESIVTGITNIDNNILEATKIETSNFFKSNFLVKLPLAKPVILSGIASSFALSFKIEIMAEIISGDTGYGIGSRICYLQNNDPGNMVPIFAYSLMAIILMLLITFIFSYLKKKLSKISY